MPDLVEHTFSFKDLLSPDQAANPRWVALMEVIDQLYEEFVYPELEQTKKLKSIYTAEGEDLDLINADRFGQLFESVQSTDDEKRTALWIKDEIIKAKNRDDAILLAVASLGYAREAVLIARYYSPKADEYRIENLRRIEAVATRADWFLTSKIGVSLDRNMIHAAGQDPLVAEEEVSEVLQENVLPEHVEMLGSYHSSTEGLMKVLGYVYQSKKIHINTVV